MNEINLLPQELKPDRRVMGLANNLKKISFLGAFIFLLAVTLALATYLLFQQRTTSSLANQEKLKNQIEAMEETEQRLVLVKDRLTKISSIRQKGDSNDEVVKLVDVSSLFPEGVKMSLVELAPDNAVIAVSSENLSQITSYLAAVISNGNFERINLVSLEFNPDTGYSVALDFPE